MKPISIAYPIRPKARSLACGRVADLFGLAEREPPHVVAENVTFDIQPGDLVLFTGPSGSGKSSLMRAAVRDMPAIDAATMELPDVPLVDALPGTIEERLGLLSSCGLSEARLLLRTPGELSDGQRYRFRIALALRAANAESGMKHRSLRSRLVLLDEFTAALDRTLAKVVAFNLRKLVTRTGVTVLAATTHEDIVDDLNPNMHVKCRGDGFIEVERRRVKKKTSASHATFGSRTAPRPTGHTSRGGITAVTGSPSRGRSCCSGIATNRSASASSPPRPRA